MAGSKRIALAVAVAVQVAQMASAAFASAGTWPDVEERIARDLDSPDIATRRTAAHDLAKLHGSGVDSIVRNALDDPDAEVKLAGADAAIRLRVAGSTEAVLPWLGDRDVRVRIAACSVARALPDAKAIAPLGRALADGDPQVRAAAAEALGVQPSNEANAPTASNDAAANSTSVTPPLLGRLDDSTPAVRIAVVRALAKTNDARAVAPLIGKIQDSTAEVRIAVVRALGDIGDPRAVQALILALRDANPQVRSGSLDALGRLHGRDTGRDTGRDGGHDSGHDTTAVSSGALDAVDAMAGLLDDRDPWVRRAAAMALGKIAPASPAAIRALEAALGSDDVTAPVETPVRAALVAAGPAAVPSLLALLDRSPSPRAMAGAAWVLGAEKRHEAAAKIVLALRRGAIAPAAALHALAGAGAGAGNASANASEDRDLPVVLEYLSDPNPAVRDEALAAASALLDPSHPDGRAVEPLAALLRDARTSANTATRASVLRLLGRTGAARAVGIVASYARARGSAASAGAADPTHEASTADRESRLAAIDALGSLTNGQTSDPSTARSLDDALLSCIFDAHADVRLHAAVALADAGGDSAREGLLAAMKRGDEVDMSAVTTALAGILARRPTDAATAAIVHAIDLAGGAERDALLAVLGRIPTAGAVAEIAHRVHLDSDDDRRAIAMVVPAEGAAGADAARTLLGDRDPRVRAQAAWSLGTLRDAASVDALQRATRDADRAVAADAVGALGRIFAGSNRTADAVRTFCPFVRQAGDPYLRANALASLALAKARCADGASERAALENDVNEDVRLSAARAIAAAPINAGGKTSDRSALDRCAAEDSAPRVAAVCTNGQMTAQVTNESASRPRPVTIFVVPASRDRPEALAPYVLALPDGTYRLGVADRRGALVEPAAPAGELSLRPPAPASALSASSPSASGAR